MTSEVRILGIAGLPEIKAGDDLGALILEAATRQGIHIEEGDVLVVAQKIVSKAEGRIVDLAQVKPSPLALQIASDHGRDPRHIEVILWESKRIVRMDRGVIIVETRHGFRCANAGVDASNVAGDEKVTLLPQDADASAWRIRIKIRKARGVEIGVIVSDTFGRPWREGATNVAIGVTGLSPLRDYRSQKDPYGSTLRTTVIAVADELASAAELVMGKLDKVAAALVKGYRYPQGDPGISMLIRPQERDLFR